MKKGIVVIILLMASFFLSSFTHAIEPVTGREVVERLAIVETKIDSLEKNIGQLREDMNTRGKQLRGDLKQLREDMNSQFNRMTWIMLGIVSAFVVLLSMTIGFALWDRRTMIKPFEEKVKKIEEKIDEDHARLHSLLDAFRTLSKTDKRVAEVLRSLNLL